MISAATESVADNAALAHNQTTNAVDVAGGYDTQQDAEDTALKACKRYSSGKKGCKIVLATKACFVVIRDENNKRTWTEGRSSHKARKA